MYDLRSFGSLKISVYGYSFVQSVPTFPCDAATACHAARQQWCWCSDILVPAVVLVGQDTIWFVEAGCDIMLHWGRDMTQHHRITSPDSSDIGGCKMIGRVKMCYATATWHDITCHTTWKVSAPSTLAVTFGLRRGAAPDRRTGWRGRSTAPPSAVRRPSVVNAAPLLTGT